MSDELNTNHFRVFGNKKDHIPWLLNELSRMTNTRVQESGGVKRPFAYLTPTLQNSTPSPE